MFAHAKRIGALAALLIVLAVPSFAAAQAAPAPAAPDSARLALARRLVIALHFSEKFSKAFANGFTQSQAKQLPKSLRDSMLAEFVKASPELVDSLVPIYAASMPRADLEAVVGFFESPVGQRYVVAESAIEANSLEFVKRWGMRIAMATMTRMMNKGQFTADSM